MKQFIETVLTIICLLLFAVSHKGFFRKQDLIVLIKEVIATEDRHFDVRGNLTWPDMQRHLEFIKDVIVRLRVTIYNKDDKKERSRQVIKGIANVAPKIDWFEIEKDGVKRKINVYDYYKKEKNYTIINDQLPCVILLNESHIPIEVCFNFV